jgi:hypothetical protein
MSVFSIWMRGGLPKQLLGKIALTAYGTVAVSFFFAFFVDNVEIDGWAEKAALIGIQWTILPFIASGAFVAWGWRNSDYSVRGRWNYYVAIIISIIVLCVMSGLTVTFINTFIGKSESIVIQGRVVRESTRDYRRPQIVIINDQGTKWTLITDKQGNQLKVGDLYKRSVKRGSLGLLYIWRFSQQL